jgi:DNA processing protein
LRWRRSLAVSPEHAAVVALLRHGRRPPGHYVSLLEAAESAVGVLEAEMAGDGAQTTLWPEPPAPLLEQADAELAQWQAAGLAVVTVRDDEYPRNLKEVHDRPPLLFVAGQLAARDQRSVAVIGARRASEEGLAIAASFTSELTAGGWVVISGLAAGIDTAAHRAALEHGGRTLAVIGNGLRHSYPAENADLQQTIAQHGAVISQFWPDSPPTRRSFPMRNAVMSGVSRGSVVIEASERSGARVQARLALAHGRPVFLHARLLSADWAKELAERNGAHVVEAASQVIEVLARHDASGPDPCPP